jgi:3-oxoacyl-[acyl-carrier-protein] synthase II
MKASVTGIGWVTPAGCGCGRETSLQPLCHGSLEIPRRKQVFTKADMRFGRLDEFSRVGLAAVTFCLRDAGLEEWDKKRPIGIIAASRYGCLPTDLAYLDTLIPDQGKLASPNLFAYTLANSFLGEAALRFGLTGNTLVFNHTDPTSLSPLCYALEELQWTHQQAIIAGICDLPAVAEFSGRDETPGGLFFLLGHASPADRSAYGELDLRDGKLFFADELMTDLPALVAACLAAEK